LVDDKDLEEAVCRVQVRADAVSLKEEVLDEAVQRHVVAEVPATLAQQEEQRVLQGVIRAVELVNVAKARTRTVYDNFLGTRVNHVFLVWLG